MVILGEDRRQTPRRTRRKEWAAGLWCLEMVIEEKVGVSGGREERGGKWQGTKCCVRKRRNGEWRGRRKEKGKKKERGAVGIK